MKHPPYRLAVVHDDRDDDLSDLENVPQAYLHSRCGKVTPNDVAITRRIHREPLNMFKGGNAAGCNFCPKESYPSHEFTWVETNENVQSYYHGIIAEEHLAKPTAWRMNALKAGLFNAFIVALIGIIVTGLFARKLEDKSVSLVILLVSLLLTLVTPPFVIAYKFWIRQKRLRDYRENFGNEDIPYDEN